MDKASAGEFEAAQGAATSRRARIMVAAPAVLVLSTALAVTIATPVRPLLVWNASSSAPEGLYTVAAPGRVGRGNMVIARLAEPWRKLADERGYLPSGVPLVKRVVAAAGDRVCAQGAAVFVNAHEVARRRQTDGRGRRLPWWHGCMTLGDGAVLLVMPGLTSFDGRYFGPTRRDDLLGEASLLWAS